MSETFGRIVAIDKRIDKLEENLLTLAKIADQQSDLLKEIGNQFKKDAHTTNDLLALIKNLNNRIQKLENENINNI